MAKQPYLVNQGVTDQDYCDWCERYEYLDEFYHGDIAVLALCWQCIKNHVSKPEGK